MKSRLSIIVVVLLLDNCLLGNRVPAQDSVEPLLKNPPGVVQVRASNVATAAQTKAIGERLGGALERLTNTDVVIFGKPLRVNVVTTADEKSAEAVFETLVKLRGEAFCLRKNQQIVEFVGKDLDPALAMVASLELGLRAKPSIAFYRVTAEIATIDEADYNSCNELFIAFLAHAKTPSAKTTSTIERLSRTMEFGRSLTLRSAAHYVRPGEYRFEPRQKAGKEMGGSVTYEFNAPSQREGVAYVTATLDLAVDATGITPDLQAPSEGSTRATTYWPADDEAVKKLAAEITHGSKSSPEKVAAILKWLQPGKNLKYTGDTGSRHGALQVLKQSFGRCWDFSDVFISLCRAEGIPCRQVAGWLYGVSGHVWAEYYLPGEGWQQVDPTGGGKLPCGIYHIPYFTSEDGRMPIVYLSMPKIEWKTP